MNKLFTAIGREFKILISAKGQLISKANCQDEDSPKKRTKEFVFTSMRRVFIRFLGESSARKNVSRLSDLYSPFTRYFVIIISLFFLPKVLFYFVFLTVDIIVEHIGISIIKSIA